MVVSCKENGVSAYCFRCGESGWLPTYQSLRDKLDLTKVRQADDEARSSMYLPRPEDRDVRGWPREARLWLYRMGFGHRLISETGLYWNGRMARVVVPVYGCGGPLYWQARAVDGRQPKWLGPSQHPSAPLSFGTGGEVVLCEDVMSTIKVSQVSEAWWLRGTKLPVHVLASLVSADKPVVTWLDSDEAGRTGARECRSKLRAAGVAVRDVVTRRDPKWYDKATIAEVLK